MRIIIRAISKHLTMLGGILALVLLPSCALFQKKNLVLVHAVEEHLVPESTSLKILTAPIYLPIGITAGVLDVFLVHPVSVIPKTGAKTIEVLWTPRDLGYYTRWGSVPFSLLATPPFFLVSWSYYWFFEGERHERQKMEIYDQAEWISRMDLALLEKDRQFVENRIGDCHGFPESEEVFSTLRRVLLQYEQDLPIQKMTLRCMVKFPTNHVTSRKIILDSFQKEEGHNWDYSAYLFRCFEPDCKTSVLSRMGKETISQDEFVEMVRIYLTIANHDEKLRFRKKAATP